MNWNAFRFLEPLLHSIRDSHPVEIIVIDNSSTDQSLDFLRTQQDILLIDNQENAGFGRAANQGFERSKTPYVLLLNADTQALPGAIDTMEQFLERNPSATIVAPQLLSADGRLQLSCRRSPTISRIALYLSYLDRVIPTGYRLTGPEHRALRRVEQPMGAVLMIRKSAFDQIGGFDPRFSLYMEEVDLCQRLRDAGYEIWYEPEAKFIHHAGGSTGQDWERSQRAYLENLFRYFEKHFSKSTVRKLRLALYPALLFRAFVLFLRGRTRESKFYLRVISTM